MKPNVPFSYLVRYGYGGLLALGITALVDSDIASKVVTTLGPVMAPLLAIGVGATIYVFERYIIGEFLIYWVQYLAHYLVDDWSDNTGKDATDAQRYIRELVMSKNDCPKNRSRWNARFAYCTAMKLFLDPEAVDTAGTRTGGARGMVEQAHGELHILWITMLQALGAWIYSLATSLDSGLVYGFGITALVAAIAGIVADIRQHTAEAVMLKAKGEEALLEFLKSSGHYVPPT